MPEIDQTLSIHCGKCIEVCEYNVLAYNEKGTLQVVNEEQCIGCGRCSEICPVGAIWLN